MYCSVTPSSGSEYGHMKPVSIFDFERLKQLLSCAIVHMSLNVLSPGVIAHNDINSGAAKCSIHV